MFNTIDRKLDQIKSHLKQIDAYRHSINELVEEIRVINACPIKVGTRVRLLEDWAAKKLNFNGWDGALHFLNPSNIATIRDVYAFEGEARFQLEFDKESWFTSDGQEKITSDKDKHLFSFKRRHFEVISEEVGDLSNAADVSL